MTTRPEPARLLPTGTVTFLRTDVEGSMGLIRTLGPDWDETNATHLGILRDTVERHGGVCVRTEGDAMFAAFPEAGVALRAAIDGQLALDAQPWPNGSRIRVRMGLHSGEAHLAGDDYGGFDVNRAARVAAVGHGGQIILSGSTNALVSSGLGADAEAGVGAGFTIRDLGRHVLKDVPAPEHLYQVDIPGRRTAFPPLRIAETMIGNLPVRLTSFVGRSRELDELRGLLEANRLVTLTGPGGIGKTSLAIELARDQAGSMPDGVWFVGLEAIADPAMVSPAIARALGLFDGVERPAVDALPSFLGARSLLLVLDNFEQVLDAAGDVATLLRLSAGSRFIVTSRAPLHLAGEQEYPVHALPVDGAGGVGSDHLGAAASTQLFIDRARAVRPDWTPGADALAVSEVCDLLDGLPLGIELAAARVSLLPVAAIRDRLAARSPLPGSGPRDAPARQRTLEGAIEWSHDLLTPEDQGTLHRLGVFEGTFDAAQVQHVVGPSLADGGSDVVDRLVSLAEQSLISRDQASPGDDARLEATGIRFGMLRTVQGFAVTRLAAGGHEAGTRARHAEAYLALAEAASVHLNSARQPPWLDRLARDDANLQAALRWSTASGDVDAAQRLLAALWRYWLLQGRLGEGALWVEAVFAMPGSDRPTKARVGALSAAGGIAYWRAEKESSVRWYEAQLEVATAVEDAPGIAEACSNLASARFVDGDAPGSLAYALEARSRFEALGDQINVSRIDWGLTNLTISTKGPAAAAVDIGRNYERAQALGDAPYVALSAGTLAWAAFMQGDVAAAGHWAIRSMLGNYALRDLAGTTVALPIGAVIALGTGHPLAAATILGAFESLCERYGVRPPAALATLIMGADPLERVRAELAPDVLADAMARGRPMALGEVLDLIVNLGRPPTA